MSAMNKEPESTVLNDSATPDITQTSLESNLNRLSVEALRFVCRGMGLSETGQKQEIVSRLLKESRNRLGREDSVEDAGVTGKAKEARPQLLGSQDDTLSEELEALWTGDRAQRPVVGENSLGAYGKQGSMGQDFSPSYVWERKPLSYGTELGPLLVDDIERRSVWTKRELTKQRNQCEYNEWCRAVVLMDKALASGDVNYIRMARQVAMERAYVVRVADEDGWKVAAKMANVDGLDPMTELEHKVRNLCDLTKGSAVRLIVEGIKRSQALVKTEARWPRDPLPVAVVKRYIMYPPPGISMVMWARDIALVAL
ncbi:3645_t:CDS:2, partial [Racocetra fulgida]